MGGIKEDVELPVGELEVVDLSYVLKSTLLFTGVVVYFSYHSHTPCQRIFRHHSKAQAQASSGPCLDGSERNGIHLKQC